MPFSSSGLCVFTVVRDLPQISILFAIHEQTDAAVVVENVFGCCS